MKAIFRKNNERSKGVPKRLLFATIAKVNFENHLSAGAFYYLQNLPVSSCSKDVSESTEFNAEIPVTVLVSDCIPSICMRAQNEGRRGCCVLRARRTSKARIDF